MYLIDSNFKKIDLLLILSSSQLLLQLNMTSEQKKKVYLIVDIEADNESPSLGSMLALGAVVMDPETGSFIDEREWCIKELPGKQRGDAQMKFWEVNKDAWNYITNLNNVVLPGIAMNEFYNWIGELQKSFIVETWAMPAAYDWQWIHEYLTRFVNKNLLGFKAKCISSYFDAMRDLLGEHGAAEEFADKNFPHTHKPLDDVRSEARILYNMKVYCRNFKKKHGKKK